MWTDYYAVLGVAPAAEDIVIRAAYRAMAQRYHPDKRQGAAGEVSLRMQAINAAYAVLGEPKARARYDATRRARLAGENVRLDHWYTGVVHAENSNRRDDAPTNDDLNRSLLRDTFSRVQAVLDERRGGRINVYA